MNIQADIHPNFMDHFKSQLLFYEVTKSDVSIIFDGGGFQDRHYLMTTLLKRSFLDFPSKKTLRFWVFTGDNRPVDSVNGLPLFSISGPRYRSDLVIPDPYLVKWSQVGVEDYESYSKEITKRSLIKPEKISVVWRGSSSMHPVRSLIVNECNKINNPLIDVKNTPPDPENNSFVQMKELTNWAILCDMPGRGFSARLKYLLRAHRPIVVFEREEWDAVTMLMEPGIDFVSCPPDIEIFKYTIEKIISQYDNFIERTRRTVDLISKITDRNNISSLLVKKISSNVD